MTAGERVTRSETIDELQRQLIRLFPRAELKRLIDDEIKTDLERKSSSSNRRDFSISPSEDSLNLYIDKSDGTRVWGYTISSTQKFNEHERRFAREFIRVFNDDVRAAPRWGRYEELWLSLQQTRLSRVIARVSPFNTPIFLKWLRAFENALSLRYERQPFSIQLVLTKQLEWVKCNPAVDYVKFSDAMSLTEALFKEKWTRALAASDDLALVGLGHDRGICGIIYVNNSIVSDSRLIAPHIRLKNFCAVRVPGTMAFLASPQGELRVLFPNGAMFTKTQGHWGMSNLLLLQETLAEFVSSSVAEAITRLAAYLSYEGHGALFCCISDLHSLRELVPDHSDGNRVNRALRLMSRRLRITIRAHQVLLRKVSAIDGAIVLGPDGSILDAGCMICDPTDAILARVGRDRPKRFPGARSTAAWNASLHGIAVKISEDGPITVPKQGKMILQV